MPPSIIAKSESLHTSLMQKRFLKFVKEKRLYGLSFVKEKISLRLLNGGSLFAAVD